MAENYDHNLYHFLMQNEYEHLYPKFFDEKITFQMLLETDETNELRELLRSVDISKFGDAYEFRKLLRSYANDLKSNRVVNNETSMIDSMEQMERVDSIKQQQRVGVIGEKSKQFCIKPPSSKRSRSIDFLTSMMINHRNDIEIIKIENNLHPSDILPRMDSPFKEKQDENDEEEDYFEGQNLRFLRQTQNGKESIMPPPLPSSSSSSSSLFPSITQNCNFEKEDLGYWVPNSDPALGFSKYGQYKPFYLHEFCFPTFSDDVQNFLDNDDIEFDDRSIEKFLETIVKDVFRELKSTFYWRIPETVLAYICAMLVITFKRCKRNSNKYYRTFYSKMMSKYRYFREDLKRRNAVPEGIAQRSCFKNSKQYRRMKRKQQPEGEESEDDSRMFD